MLQQKTYNAAEDASLQGYNLLSKELPLAFQRGLTGKIHSEPVHAEAVQMHPFENGLDGMGQTHQQMSLKHTDEVIRMSPETNKSSEPLVTSFTGSQAAIQRYSNPFYWCDALMRLIEYEDAHGRLNTLVEYNSFDNDDLIPLNYNIPSIYGEVDVDWMLRLAVIQYPFIIGSIFTPSMSEGFGGLASRAAYLALKTFWVAIDPRTSSWNWDSILEEGNWNSANVIVRWIHGQETLRDIFAPAIPLCQGQPSAPPDTREPTY